MLNCFKNANISTSEYWTQPKRIKGKSFNGQVSVWLLAAGGKCAARGKYSVSVLHARKNYKSTETCVLVVHLHTAGPCIVTMRRVGPHDSYSLAVICKWILFCLLHFGQDMVASWLASSRKYTHILHIRRLLYSQPLFLSMMRNIIVWKMRLVSDFTKRLKSKQAVSCPGSGVDISMSAALMEQVYTKLPLLLLH